MFCYFLLCREIFSTEFGVEGLVDLRRGMFYYLSN